MLVNVVVGCVVVRQHMPLHDRLRTKAKALWAPVSHLLRLPALTLLQVSPLNKSFALGTPDAEDAVGSQTFSAMKALLADITNELEEKKFL